MSTATRGLSIADVDSIRETLAAGRRPKVLFTEAAGQIAGQVGQVVKLTDPDASEDFLVVRFGRDELPFSPADLTIPPRGSGPAKAARSAAQSKDTAAKTPAADRAPTEDGPADTTRGNAGNATANPMPPGPPLLPSPREEQTSMPTSKAAPATPAAAEEPTPVDAPAPAPAPRKAAKQARPKAPAGLTVTLAYTEGEWTVAAQQGSKALARPYVIKPTEALKMVAMLDVAGVQEAVEAIVASERADAQQHAERLRAQLAEIEAKLAELGVDS